MTKDEEGYIVGELVPNPKYSGCWYNSSIVWEDERPYPTQEEINQRYMEWIMAQETAESNAAAWVIHNAALEAGYVHTDSIRYYCNEKATNDMVKVVVLFDIDPSEPVYVITYDNTPTSMSLADFKLLAIAIGRYQYQLRQNLWNELM